MASSYTQNYKLCQWEAEDKVLRTEFNADNAKIDAAIAAVDRRVDTLSSTVGGKASQSALNSLSQTVSRHGEAISKLGNCLFYATSYVGTGTQDESNPPSLTFPHRPMVVFISCGHRRLTLVQGSSSYVGSDGNGAAVTAAWSGKSVSWTSRYSYAWMNDGQQTYSVVALLDAAQ